MTEKIIVGIDFSTLFVRIGICRKIRNECSFQLLDQFPAVVKLDFIGKDHHIDLIYNECDSSNSKNIIYNVKRLIGRKFSDPEVQDLFSIAQFKIVEGEDSTISNGEGTSDCQRISCGNRKASTCCDIHIDPSGDSYVFIKCDRRGDNIVTSSCGGEIIYGFHDICRWWNFDVFDRSPVDLLRSGHERYESAGNQCEHCDCNHHAFAVVRFHYVRIHRNK